MGCGCNKRNGMRSVGNRPSITPRRLTATPKISANKTPTEVKAMKSITPSVTKAGLTKERRAIERKRRDIITRKGML
jgi:hypothetical protein